ncbi:UNVERIFIED_CONTAM: DUF637 domain-containing protein [Acinetobacter baumannii]
MNKNLYRIIFNKARNMFMAVAENVRSQSKAAGQSSSSEIVSYGQSSGQEKSFHQLWHVKALVTSMSLLVPFAPVYADIVADSAANAANRAVIAAGKNSAGTTVPVVNIQTPKNGISHNIYKQFDVLAEGAVLNNSRQGATTKTVGAVAANPFLATGEARVILNEVNSTVASRFEGNLEVAGQMADVIIANPSGINIKGGGFINANKAIFTTGKPQLNADGSIKQFTVDQGRITVSANLNSKFGLGGNNNDANYVDLYARALELSAELRAKNDIQVIAGANNVSADLQDVTAKTGTGTAPTLAVDVKALGGMYANNIYLMGTEKGLGVTNAGTLQAVNNLVITSAGKIEHSGTISSTSKTQGLVSVQTTGVGVAADINSSGSINSNGMLNIDSGNNLNVNAKEIIINNGSLASSPLIINTKGNLNLAANSRIFNDAQSGELYVDAANINLATNAGITSNRGSAYIQSQKDVVAAQGAKLIAAQNLNVSGRGKLSLNENQIQASLGSINLQVDSSNTDGLIDIRGGTIYGGKDLNLYSSGDVNLQNLGFALENSVTRVKNINAHSGRNLVWNNATKVLPQITGKVALDAENNLSLSSQGFSSKGGIQLQADQLTLNTALTSQNNISLTAEIADLVLDNALTAQNDINVTALAGNLKTFSLKANSIAGKISLLANKDVNLSSMQHFDSMASYDVITTDKTNINGAKGVVVGSTGEGALSISATDIMANQGNVQLISNNGLKILANNDVSMHNDDNGRSVLSPTTITAQNININNKKNDLVVDNGTSFIAANELKINSEGKLNFKNSILNSKGNTEISSKDHLTLLGVTANSDKHLALSSKKNIYINGEYGTTTVWTPYVESNLTAKGILSMTSGGSHAAQNTTYTGGAISLEAGNVLTTPSNATLTFNAVDSVFLRSDPALKDLNGDLTIQTNGALTIDPKIHTLNAKGDVQLISKNGALNLNGYGGKNGNGSEQVVKIQTTDGNINLIGTKVHINGAKLQASSSNAFIPRDINITATDGDVVISGVKNTAVDYVTQKRIQEIGIELSALDAQIERYKQDQANYKAQTFESMVQQRNIMSQGLEMLKTKGKAIEHSYAEILPWTKAAAIGTGTPYWAKGNVNILSNGGIKLEGTQVDGLSVLIRAKGLLSQDPDVGNKTEILPNNVVIQKSPTSIYIAGLLDEFEYGVAGANNYGYASFNTPSYINGSKSVKIETLGGNNGLTIVSSSLNGGIDGVNLAASGDLRLEATQEELYKYSTKTYKTGNWYKRKTVTETETYNTNTPTPTSIISNRDIKISSNGSLTLVSTDLQSHDGNINLNAGGYLRLWTKPTSQFSQIDVSKKSKLFGVKYNTSTVSSTRSVESELPAVLVAQRNTNLSSGNTTWIRGSEFENKLGHAEIKAGVGENAVEGAQIILQDIVTKITETKKRDSNSVVWQSMQDKGSITETAKLPSFNGPTPPIFKATGGLSVQIPISEKDANKIVLRDEILKLANQSGNTYLKDLVNRNDVDWQKVLLTQKDWDYKSQGLTGAGAAIIAIIVVAATAGAGATVVGALGGTASTLGGSAVAMSQAAITTIASQASISLINNGGDIGKTLNDLGSKESIRNLAASVVTAGLLSQVSTALNLKPDSTLFPDRLMNNFTTSVGSTLVQTAINGGNLGDNLQVALLAGLAGALQGELASQIGTSLDKVDPNIFEYTIHKIAHAAVGCATAAATKSSCEAGAIGAGVGEIVAGLMPEPANGIEYTDAEKLKIRNIGKLVSGTVAAYTGYDVNTAANSADTAIQNNSLVRLATTTGKVLVKTLDKYNALRKTGKQVTKDDIVASLKEQSADELIGIADDLLTVFGRSTSPFDRAMAAIDLVVGTDLKPGKGEALKLAKSELDKLKIDRSYVQTVYQNRVDVVTRNRMNGKEFETSVASKLGVKRNTDRQMITIKTERDGQINIIPDAFGNGGTLVEFKNVQYLTDTKQLRGYAATGKPVSLVVNMNTKISETVKNNILSNKGTIQRFDPIKQTLHPY